MASEAPFRAMVYLDLLGNEIPKKWLYVFFLYPDRRPPLYIKLENRRSSPRDRMVHQSKGYEKLYEYADTGPDHDRDSYVYLDPLEFAMLGLTPQQEDILGIDTFQDLDRGDDPGM